MPDDNVIDIRDLISQKQEVALKNKKQLLNKAIDGLDIKIEDILNKYVIPDESCYNHNMKDDKDISLLYSILALKNTISELERLGMEAAANDIAAVVNKLNSNFYGDSNEV